jgi:hypothetical protein
MATQLKGVIQRMAKVNENLEGLAADSDTVSDVGKLWRESFQIAKEVHAQKEMDKDDSAEQPQQRHSSLHVFTRGL